MQKNNQDTLNGGKKRKFSIFTVIFRTNTTGPHFHLDTYNNGKKRKFSIFTRFFWGNNEHDTSEIPTDTEKKRKFSIFTRFFRGNNEHDTSEIPTDTEKKENFRFLPFLPRMCLRETP